jgi:hypothetical protein
MKNRKKKYPDGGPIGVEVPMLSDGTPAVNLSPFEVSDQMPEYMRVYNDEYNRRMAASKALQEKWYANQEFDETPLQRRAEMAGNDAAADFILKQRRKQGKSVNDFANRQEYLKSFNDKERSIIQNSNFAGNLEPDAGTKFRAAASKLIQDNNPFNYLRKQPSSNLFNDPDLTQEEYDNASRFGLLAPLGVPVNSVKALFKGDSFKDAVRGETQSPWRSANQLPLGQEGDAPIWDTAGNAVFDPLNLTGVGLAEGAFDDVAKIPNVFNAGKTIGKKIVNTPKVSLAFQSPAERLVNPEAYRVLTGKSSGIRGNMLENYYNFKQKNIIKAQNKLNNKVFDARRSNKDDLAESFIQKRDALNNDYDKIQKSINEWRLKYSGLPITRTNMGGGQGSIFKNNLNQNELIKVGSYFGNEQSLNDLVNLGKTYNNPNVVAAFPTKAIPFTKTVESNGFVGQNINAAQFMPKLDYNSGLYSASEIMTPEQIKFHLNNLNELGLGIDYTGSAGNIGRVGDKLGLVDLTYVGPAGKRTTNYFDREGLFNPGYRNQEVLGRFNYDINDWSKARQSQQQAQGGYMYSEGGTIDPPDGVTRPNQATRADSIAVLNNALQLEKYYKNKRYKSRDEVDFNSPVDEKNNIRYFQENNRSGIVTNRSNSDKLRLSDYYINLDKNKFLMREGANSILDLRAPIGLYDRRIYPQTYISYDNVDTKDVLSGDVAGLYKYAPLAVTPWDMLNEAQRKERVRKYGRAGVPSSWNSSPPPPPPPRKVRPNIDRLEPKQSPEDFDTIGLVGTPQAMPPTAPMTANPEGHYRVTRVSPYADPTYQVWENKGEKGSKWEDMSKEKFDKISQEKHLTEYKYGGDMRKRKLKLNSGGFPFAQTLPTEWGGDDFSSWDGEGFTTNFAQNQYNQKNGIFDPITAGSGPLSPDYTAPQTTPVASTAYKGLDSVLPGAGTAAKLGDQVTGMAIDAGNSFVSNKMGYRPDEQNIAFKYSKKLDSIPLVGSQIGGAIDAVRTGTGRVQDEIKDFRLNKQKANSSAYLGAAKSYVMAKGGELPFTEYEGLTHDEIDPMTGETGVQFDPHPDPNMPDIEVEAGETSFDSKVFTDREEYKKGVTFAAQSKKYNKELEMRPTDKISKDVAKKKLDRLFAIQEARKAAQMDKYSVMKADAMSSPYGEKIMAKYGGKLKMAPGGGLPNGMETISVDNIMELSGINENALNLAQMGQLVAPVMQGIQAATDKDVLKFDRVQVPKIDTKTPVDILRQQSKEQVATAASNIARNAGNQGQYLAARGALGARAASDLGRNVALMSAELQSKQAAMDFEGNRANTTISNTEKEYAQNRKDSRRKVAVNAVDEGFSRYAGKEKDDAAFRADLFEEVTKANALGGEEFMYVFDPKDRKMKYIRRPK